MQLLLRKDAGEKGNRLEKKETGLILILGASWPRGPWVREGMGVLDVTPVDEPWQK